MIVIGILVDTLQPPHLGIKQAYDSIVRDRGSQYSYVVVTDKKNSFDSSVIEPLNAADKKQILIKHGVPSDKIINGKTPFDTDEIENVYDPADTAVIFYFFSNKSHLGFQNDRILPWHEMSVNGSSTFKNEIKPMSDAFYYKVLSNDIGKVRGVNLNNTKLFVEELGDPNNSDDNKKTFFALAFGWYDSGFFNLLKERFRNSYEKFVSRYSTAINKPSMEESIAELSKIMAEDLMDQVGGMFDDDNSKSDSGDDLSPTQKLAKRKSDIENLKSKEKTLSLTKKQSEAEKKLAQNKIRQQTKDISNAKRNLTLSQRI
jgi:hypothetical protein